MAESRARKLAGWLVRRPHDRDPVVAWHRLPREWRADALDLARRGEAHPFPSVRAAAAAWASDTLARPFLPALARNVAAILVGAGAGALVLAHFGHDGVWCLIGGGGGGTLGTLMGLLSVHARARRVLRANGGEGHLVEGYSAQR